MNPCLQPVPNPKDDGQGDDRWQNVHKLYVQEAQTLEPEVVLIGDSIIQQMQISSLWNEKFCSLHCLNFGIGGDRVEHVLWRVLNGELDFTSEIKAVVLFVGTNNTGTAPDHIYEGIVEIVKVIKKKLQDVIVVLPTLLPRGYTDNPNRERVSKVNDLLESGFGKNGSLHKDIVKNVYVVPIHDSIVQADGTISHHLMYDYLHLTNEGYTKIFGPVYETLRNLLQIDQNVL